MEASSRGTRSPTSDSTGSGLAAAVGRRGEPGVRASSLSLSKRAPMWAMTQSKGLAGRSCEPRMTLGLRDGYQWLVLTNIIIGCYYYSNDVLSHTRIKYMKCFKS
jgi:hypothetical protein